MLFPRATWQLESILATELTDQNNNVKAINLNTFTPLKILLIYHVNYTEMIQQVNIYKLNRDYKLLILLIIYIISR